MRLTKRDIERATKRRKYSDGRGLFLSVSANGRKTWAFCYTFAGRAREMGLGSIDFMTIDEARDRAVQLRKLVRDGVDPLAERNREAKAEVRRKRSEMNFKQVAERVIEKKLPEWGASGKSEESWRGSFKNHVYPTIGDRDINDLDRLDIRDLLRPLWVSHAVTAQRLLPRIEEVFEYAALEGLRTGENPADRHKLRRMLPKAEKIHKAKSHSAIHYNEMPAFMTELRALDSHISARALEFLILTAARTTEVIEAKWDEIDLEAAVWTIPADRMKAGKEHRVPLSAPAIALICQLRAEDDNPYLFISPDREKSGLSNMAMLKLLKETLKRGATVHGFRSSFRDWVSEETDHPDSVAEMALAHTIESKVEAAYRRGDLFEKRKALMADWAVYLARTVARDHGKEEAA